jgi:hypothetical protein
MIVNADIEKIASGARRTEVDDFMIELTCGASGYRGHTDVHLSTPSTLFEMGANAFTLSYHTNNS